MDEKDFSHHISIFVSQNLNSEAYAHRHSSKLYFYQTFENSLRILMKLNRFNIQEKKKYKSRICILNV